MDDAFGHWLAGFVDGEGCFTTDVSRRYRASRTHAAMRLELRVDDLPILEEVQRRTGLGNITILKPRKGYEGAVWRVERKSDCLALVALFDRYPLRAKKARDYAIWREFVLAWSVTRVHGPRDWVYFEELHQSLKTGRRMVAA